MSSLEPNLSKPMVSVVMPVFNALPWLSEAIDSVLSQTYTNFEFVIVDDCSSDGSLDLLREYEKQDNRVKLIVNEKNLGVAGSLNRGVAQSSGVYIARMDADDVSYPERFYYQVNYMQDNPGCVVVGSWIDRLRKNGSKKLKKFPEDSDALKLLLMFECCFSHPAVMMRRSALLSLPFVYDERFSSAQDYELWSRLQYCGDFCCLQTSLLMYRELDTSVSMQARKKNLKRERVNLIYDELLRYRGFSGEGVFNLHKMIVHKERRWAQSPRLVINHLKSVLSVFPEASGGIDIVNNVFSGMKKNPIFLAKYLTLRLFGLVGSVR